MVFMLPSSYAPVPIKNSKNSKRNLKNQKFLYNKHEHVFSQHGKNILEKIHVLICAKKTNLVVQNNKFKCSKQHQIL
jgi:hypothetical protein